MTHFNKQLVAVIPQLRRYARSLEFHSEKADDLVQDCLLRAVSKQHLCDSSKPIRPWLFTIMHNVFINSVNKLKLVPEVVSIDQVEEIHQNTTIDSSLTDLNKAFKSLSVEHREILSLVGLEQMSYKETATILDIPVGTVMSRLARARKSLHSIMNESGQTQIRRIK